MVSRIYKIIIVVVVVAAVVIGESTGQKDLSKFLLFRGWVTIREISSKSMYVCKFCHNIIRALKVAKRRKQATWLTFFVLFVSIL